MKNKTLLKFLICFVIIGNFICSQFVVLATPTDEYFFNASTVGYFDKTVIDGKLTPVKHIQSLIMYFATFVSVIVVAIYAIQWMTANPAKRQELKAAMWPLTIGVVLLVIGPRLAVSLYNAFNSVAHGEITSAISGFGMTSVGIIRTVGYVVGAIMILVVAVQWMTSPPNKRQELKGKMTNILIGAILLIAGVSILGLIEKFATDITLSEYVNADRLASEVMYDFVKM